MIQSVIAGIIGAIANVIMGIFAAKQAKQDEYQARSLEQKELSLKEGVDRELKIQKAQAEIPKVSNLQSFKDALLIAVVCLVIAGCTVAKVDLKIDSYNPEIKTKKPSPAMTQGPEELTEREKALMNYVLGLRTAISTYNAQAREANAKSKYPLLDLPPESEFEVLLPKAQAEKPIPQEVKSP